MSSLRIELITIGDELLLGFTIDTNAAHISRTLAATGVEIVRRTTVGDDAEEIAGAVREALVEAHFSPARKRGRLVRQLVQLPISFALAEVGP